MSVADQDFHAAISGALARDLPGFIALNSCARLSGGASQESYRLAIASTHGPLQLVLRRTPGGVPPAPDAEQIGPRVEALVVRAARAAGVPAAEILAELAPQDGLGEGYFMAWLAGEALGSRIVRSPELAAVRPHLAHQCGRILARIHAIDVVSSGLDRVLKVVPPAALVQQTWRQYQSFNTPAPLIDYTAQWLLAHLPPVLPPTLTHADFRNGNLMVSPAGHVNEVTASRVDGSLVDNRDIPDICLQHMVAVMLLDQTASFKAAHDTARMRDAAVLRQRAKVQLIGDEALKQFLPVRVAIVELTLNDGTTLTERVEAVRGTPRNPMTKAEVIDKCRDLIAPVLGARKAVRLIDTVFALEAVSGIRKLRPLLQP